MKKNWYYMLLFLFLVFPLNVFADGYISILPATITIEEGASENVTITAKNTIGDVAIQSNNPSIAAVSSSSWGTGMVGDGETKTGIITVKGKSAGTTTVTFTIDAATFDGEDLAGQKKLVTVNVIKKKPVEPKPNLSTNNKAKSVSVDGYKLNKINDNNYTLDVAPNVDSINVKVEAEDKKAKVSGNGLKELKFGENNIEIVVTSESGSKNKINIKVTRKDSYYLSDLDELINNKKLEVVDITLKLGDKVSKSDLGKMKSSQKDFNLNYYDKDKKLIYSWNFNVTELNDIGDFPLMIEFKSDNEEEIDKASNYASGLYVNFKHSGNVPKGTKIKLYVYDKFKDGSNVNVYYYSNNELDLVKSNIKVENGYVTFDIDHCSDYFITMSNIQTIKNEDMPVKVDKDEPTKIFIILTIVAAVIIIGLVTFILVKLNKNKKQLSEINTYENTNIQPEMNTYENTNIQPEMNTYENKNIQPEMNTYENKNIQPGMNTYENKNIQPEMNTYENTNIQPNMNTNTGIQSEEEKLDINKDNNNQQWMPR